MNRSFRYLLLLISLAQFIFALGFLLQIPAVTRLWPLPYTTPMSYIFISSIAFAAVASTLWCVAMDEQAAIAGIALDYMGIFVPLSILMFQLSRGVNSALILFGVSGVVMIVVGLGLLIVSLRRPARDTRPVPRLVRGSFAVFVIALIVAGGQMVLKNTAILPWGVSTEATVIYGWMFLGAAAYFAYGLLRPGWYNAGGQLAGFLAYDVILIVPFLQRLSVINPDLLPNLIIYIGVVSYSGLLAIYYLFVNPATRLWRKAVPSATAASDALAPDGGQH